MSKAILVACLSVASVVSCTDQGHDGGNVSAFINGKPLRLPRLTQHELASEALSVLRTCTYANLHPTGQYAAIVTNAPGQSHLNVTFPELQTVEIRVPAKIASSGRIKVEVREMTVTLPLSSGAFLVRSNQDTLYFAKFDCPLSQEMEKTLKKAEK